MFLDDTSRKSDRFSIVNFSHLSQDHIKSDLTAYLLERFPDKDVLNSSAFNMLLDLVAGYMSYTAFKQHQIVKEHHITRATLEDNIVELAKNYSYNINRGVCPSVEMIYIGEPIPISYGFKVGEANELDLIYFDEPRIIERGDRFTARLGRLKSTDYFRTNDDGLASVILRPEELESIDNFNIVVKLNNDIFYRVSRIIEDFITFYKPVEFSVDRYSTEVFIQNVSKFFGIKEDLINHGATILYMETAGVDLKLDRASITTITDDFEVDFISHIGSHPDSLDSIRFFSRFLYTSVRRAVTIDDYTYILENHPYLHSVFVEKDRGLPYILAWHAADNIQVYDKYLVFTIADRILYIDLDPLLFRELPQRIVWFKLLDADRPARFGVPWMSQNEIIDKVFLKMLSHSDPDIMLDLVKPDDGSTPYITVTIDADSVILDPSIKTLDTVEGLDHDNKLHTLDIYSEPLKRIDAVSLMAHKVLQEPVKPKSCCTLFVYYVAETTYITGDRYILSKPDVTDLSEYMLNYKGEVKLIYIPATELSIPFNLRLRLRDSLNRDKVLELIRDVLSKYEYRLHFDFRLDEVIAEIATILDSNGYLVDGILPVDMPFYAKLTAKFLSKRYIKWSEIKIDWL